ncbi:hypothetical protein DX130_05055 [Paenibacillus paeoniae]|uniref:Uncharacterized protein n=1 Tax=Paenibacillus paeoniae TaxID=2292705 RepID=A0A371PJN3_9BACL|nr:hypothetical protein DX130_05055 [Paenibacillus paeoniae]
MEEQGIVKHYGATSTVQWDSFGYIPYGITRYNCGQVEQVPEADWFKVMGTHEKLKTPKNMKR